jgi:hypothetical protein
MYDSEFDIYDEEIEETEESTDFSAKTINAFSKTTENQAL